MDKKSRKFMFFVSLHGAQGFCVNKSHQTLCFGNNNHGQLNVGDKRNRRVPEVVEFFKSEEILDIFIGWRFSVFRTSKRVVSCGSGENGRTALGDQKDRSIAEKVILEDEEAIISDVSVGSRSTFFLCSGRVYLAGSNRSGNRCYGLADDLVIGTRIRILKTEIEKIVSGAHTTLFFGENEIYVGGAKHVGLGPSNDVLVKLDFFKEKGLSLSSVVPAAAAVYFLCGNDVYISGSNFWGQYGNGTFDKNETNQPVLSTSIAKVDICASGWTHFVWKDVDGSIFGTGNNQNGELGLGGGTVNKVNVPTPIPMPSEARNSIGQIAAGASTTYFISNDGQTIYGTGANRIRILRTGLNLKQFASEPSVNQNDARTLELRRERLSFLSTQQPDLTVKFNDTELEIFSSLISSESRLSRRIKDGAVEINRNLRTTVFDTDLLHSLVFGADVQTQLEENIQNYLDFFLFFNAMGMRKHVYCLLKVVSKIKSLKKLVKLFISSYRKLEPLLLSRATRVADVDQMLERQNVEEISFESNFTLNIFNTLAERGVEEIRKETHLMKILESLRVWGDLTMFKIRPLENLVQFEDLQESTFNELFLEHTKILYRNLAKSGKYVVVSADEKEIHAHREILVVNSDYFFRVMKFGGRETRKEGYLLLERLNFEELTIIVEFVYTKEVTVVENGEGLVVLMNVLEEIIPYQESALQVCVMKKIFKISNSQIDSGIFLEDGLSKIGHFVSSSNRTLPEEVKKELYGEWKKKVEEEKLKEAIEKSVLKRLERKKDEEKRELGDSMRFLESKLEKVEGKFDERFEKLETEVKGKFESKFDEFDERFETLETEVSEMKTDVSEMKGSIEDILKILQGEGEGSACGRGGRKRKTGSSREEGGKRRKKKSK